MERDVTGLMHKGAEVGDLAAGLAYSVALNYLNRVVRGRQDRQGDLFPGRHRLQRRGGRGLRKSCWASASSCRRTTA
jgi:hypothetical protein